MEFMSNGTVMGQTKTISLLGQFVAKKSATLQKKGISMFLKIGSGKNANAINLDNVITVNARIDRYKEDDGQITEVKMVGFTWITEHSPGSFAVDDETYDRVRKFIDNLPD